MTSSINSSTAASSALSSGSLAGAGTISSPGIGSGLNVTAIVSELMTIERLPETQLTNQNTIIQAELTAYGTLKGALSSFQSAVQTLDTASTYTGTTATVADPTIFTASTDTTAVTGTHTIEVQQLAQSQTLRTGGFSSSSTALGTGSLTFNFGTYTTTNGVTTFSQNASNPPVTVQIPSGSDTLSGIASAINAANVGVKATIINDGTNYYLQYSPTSGGTSNQLQVTVADSDGNNIDASGLSQLAYNQASGYSTGSVAYNSGTSVTVATGTNDQFNVALDGGTTVTATLAAGTYDSTSIVSAVQTALDNALGAGTTVVSLNSSNQLVVTSTGTGSLSQVSLSAATGNTGLTDIFGTTTANSTPRNMTQSLAPQNAILTVDGTTVTEPTNTVTNAIQGVTLNLLKTSATATTLNISTDTSAISTDVGNLVSSYNTLEAMLNNLLSYDASTGKAGALQGDGTVRSIQAQIRTAMQTMASGNTNLSGLPDIGVAFQQDGSLTINSTTLQSVLSDPTKNLSDFFIGVGGSGGIADALNTTLNGILGTSGTTGLLAARTDNLNQSITNNNNQIAQMEVQMTMIEARYRAEYTNLDTLIASMNSTSSFLTQQLANLPTISASSSSKTGG